MRTRAIVIKKEHANEYDQFITCYTQEFGKITAIAKSILKKTSLQAMHLDIFNLVEFELINGKAMPIIASAQAETIFPDLKNSLPALTVAGFFASAVDKEMFDNDKDPKMWSFLEEMLNSVNQKASDSEALNNLLIQRKEEFARVSGY